MASLKINKPQNLVHVNFSNRGLSKVIKSVRSLGAGTPNKTTVVEIAKLMQDLKVARKTAVSFPSLSEFVGIDYTGYIVEKERLDKTTGNWIRIDEYRLIGSLATGFKDSRVAYGNYYRYRIKSVAKVTQAVEKASMLESEITQAAKEFEASLVQEALTTQAAVIVNVGSIANTGLNSKSSQGTAQVSFSLGAGLSVTANESQTTVVQDTPTPSTASLRQLKNLSVENIDLMQGTISDSALQKMVQDSLSFTEQKKVEYSSVYYESEPISNWIYVEIADTLPPPPPSSIKISPNTTQKSIYITWLTPAHSQRDIKSFNLYRRQKVGQTWKLLKSFPLTENVYIDKSLGFNQEYIYAITSVDVHGIESVLSTQIQAELNPNFSAERQERPLRWVSGSGARPDEGFSNIYKKFFENEVPIVVSANVVIGPTEMFKETEKKLLIRVKSLDMHETKEFVITLTNENVKIESE
jgi:hypothetical protein